MTDESGSADYISFIKGFSAAMDTGPDGETARIRNGVDTGAYAMGYAAAVDEHEPRPRYLDLSATAPIERAIERGRVGDDEVPEQGVFRGSLDLDTMTGRPRQ